jgi:hypothetical protein
MTIAPRSLTPNETATLRGLLKSQLTINTAQAEEDARDLLDYTLAMIANGKDVDYVVDEVSCFFGGRSCFSCGYFRY